MNEFKATSVLVWQPVQVLRGLIIKRISFKTESEALQVDLSRAPTLPVPCRLQKGEERSSPHQQQAQSMINHHDSVNWKPLHDSSQGEATPLQTLVFPNGRLVFNNSSQLPLFLYKVTFFWFCHSMHVPNCNSFGNS